MSRKTTQLYQKPALEKPKLVAAYARVSTGKDAMLHSLSAQVSYFSNYIQNHSGWQYVGVYFDEALTGTTGNRTGFQKLLSDCQCGKVNMIITKSISRFARNTVTLLETVRKLKAWDVDVFFEEQNIHTMSSDGELMLTILASYAQEESLSASENQKWRIRKAFENGELLNLRFLFGYTICKGHIQIDERAATIVREIFKRVIDGESYGAIYRDLNLRGITGTFGAKWNTQRIKDIITNEKYTGNALLQKHYRNNHLEKKKCPNTGELPKYYVQETHPAIIANTTFELTQKIANRKNKAFKNRSKPAKSEFTGKIRCAHCGKNYKRTVSNGTPGFNCSTYLKYGKEYCHCKKIPESILKKVCADVLEVEIYDVKLFQNSISHINVKQPNQLTFVFTDASIKTVAWQQRSRSHSWTEEMRKAASDKAKENRKWQKQ
ncbi:MAG: recombinase family protein [Christensenellaceae bacterium]